MTPYHNHRGDEQMKENWKADVASLVRFVIAALCFIVAGLIVWWCATR